MGTTTNCQNSQQTGTHAFKESMGYAEQNLYAQSMQLVGDKDPRRHEFTAQLRAFDVSKAGAKLGVSITDCALYISLKEKCSRWASSSWERLIWADL